MEIEVKIISLPKLQKLSLPKFLVIHTVFPRIIAGDDWRLFFSSHQKGAIIRGWGAIKRGGPLFQILLAGSCTIIFFTLFSHLK